MYRDAFGRRVSLEEAMARSQCFFALFTKNYLEDIRSRDPRVLSEIERAKAYHTPVILFLFEDLSEQEKQEAREVFKDHNLIKTYENMPRGKTLTEKLDQVMPEVIKLLEEMCALKG